MDAGRPIAIFFGKRATGSSLSLQALFSFPIYLLLSESKIQFKQTLRTCDRTNLCSISALLNSSSSESQLNCLLSFLSSQPVVNKRLHDDNQGGIARESGLPQKNAFPFDTILKNVVDTIGRIHEKGKTAGYCKSVEAQGGLEALPTRPCAAGFCCFATSLIMFQREVEFSLFSAAFYSVHF